MIPARIKHLVPLAWRQAFWSLPANRAANRKHYAADCDALGIWAATWLRWSMYVPRPVLSIRLRGYRHRLFFRPRTSDVAVIRQVFTSEDYRGVSALDGVQVIFDCGANIGCAAFYFLNKYPASRLVVVEPDSGNMALCQRNLEPYRDRVTFVHGGVWSSSVPLKVQRGGFADGQPWSFQVRPCVAGEASDVAGITVRDLISVAGVETVDLLKMDIELAEREVFGVDVSEWIECVRNIAIELHDAEGTALFRKAIGQSGWAESHSGDLTVCCRLVTR